MATGSFTSKIGVSVCFCLLDVHGDIHGITRGLRNGQAEIQRQDSGQCTEGDDGSPHLVGRHLTSGVTL